MGNNKIKFIADTASDIPDAELIEYSIDMPSVPIAVDGKEYWERKSFGIKEFYPVLAASKEIPATSRVPVEDFLECYKKAYVDGYTDIICVTINAGGSGTNAAAITAKEQFYNENPDTVDKIRIYIVDSRTYSAAYGHPVIQAAKMARSGKSADDIIAYLEDWFASVEIYLGCYTLEYAKKSGRITAAAAFMGDVLGLRPIVLMKDGYTKILEKIRGEKNLVKKIADICKDPDIDTSDALVIRGSNEEYAKEMRTMLKKEYGVDTSLYMAGASIIINSGPNIVALVVRRKKGNHRR